MGTHGLLRLFSPPSINKILRFLSRAASRPATTHPQEPPVEAFSLFHVLPLTALVLPPATIMSTSSGIVMMGDGPQRILQKGPRDGIFLLSCQKTEASLEIFFYI